jgi:hypothetical protein
LHCFHPRIQHRHKCDTHLRIHKTAAVLLLLSHVFKKAKSSENRIGETSLIIADLTPDESDTLLVIVFNLPCGTGGSPAKLSCSATGLAQRDQRTGDEVNPQKTNHDSTREKHQFIPGAFMAVISGSLEKIGSTRF